MVGFRRKVFGGGRRPRQGNSDPVGGKDALGRSVVHDGCPGH